MSLGRVFGRRARIARGGVVLLGLVQSLAIATGLLVVSAPVSSAAYDPSGFDFWVDSSMGKIKSRVFRASDGNTSRVVYALDGLRAQNDLNGWEINTAVARTMSAAGINVVMPVGGESSFYSDWVAPSNTNGQRETYRWETFLTQNLPGALHSRLGLRPTGNAVFGLSMGGTAALTLAAYHPAQFGYAGSFSGYLNDSAPGMREALRIALLDAGGFNIDAMWGPPWDPRWLRGDPYVFAPILRQNGTRLWIAAGNGTTEPSDVIHNPVEWWDRNTAVGLEYLAAANTHAFQARIQSLGPTNAVFDYPRFGVHSWRYWEQQVYRMLPDLRAHLR